MDNVILINGQYYTAPEGFTLNETSVGYEVRDPNGYPCNIYSFGYTSKRGDKQPYVETRAVSGGLRVPLPLAVPELVGYAEAAEILGWDKRRIGVYMQRGVFPEPVQRLASGPIWTRQQIEDYRDSRK